MTPAPAPRLHIIAAVAMALLATPCSGGADPGIRPPERSSDRSPADPEMIVIEAGCFAMGSPSAEPGRDDDEHRHRVCVARFAIGKYEVTFAEFDRFAHAMGRLTPDDGGWGRGRRPVVAVPWDDATDYARWLSEKTGRRFRLPTEAEWEYAARAGTGTTYPWGDLLGSARANCHGCGTPRGGRGTAPVGSFAANGWGLHDVVGNAWEWTCSAFASGYGDLERRCIRRDARGARTIRGGSWANRPAGVRSAVRDWTAPFARYLNLGFRLAEDL